ncbi:MAG: hypothetical protein HGA45_23830 [Chloroflexales bacterium]|nr:hypothetical protein [Chloroflexales bacterium]
MCLNNVFQFAAVLVATDGAYAAAVLVATDGAYAAAFGAAGAHALVLLLFDSTGSWPSRRRSRRSGWWDTCS